ncbi:hypothetical protein FDECE_5703 [Fusarium decemcellulare]|nr:hypothetical protein FDECE_5703 [Fusarium decemcellulare]
MYQTGSSIWSEWGEWQYNADYGQSYRQRRDTNGNVQTQWQSELAQAPAVDTSESYVPRAPVTAEDEIAQGMSAIQLQGPESVGGDDPNNNEYVTSGTSSKHKSRSSKPHKSSRSKPSKSKPKPSSRKGKGRANEDDEEEGEQEDPTVRRGSATAQASQMYATGQYLPDGQGVDDGDAAAQAAYAQSYMYNEPQYPAGEPSYSAYSTIDQNEPEEVAAAPPTSDHITGTAGDVEQLDPRFQVQHSNMFAPGEVFKVLWPEPAGGAAGAPSVAEQTIYRDQYGGQIFVHFRRFIVIANDLGHCQCVPISTYGKKGCKKSGVKAEQHGIVYEAGSRPSPLSGEPKLGFAPVRLQISEQGEKISRESRVNYSKLTTVEHNVKVLFIGRVAGADWKIVNDAVDACWNNKTHHRRHRR